MTRLTIGEKINPFPAGSFNRIVDLLPVLERLADSGVLDGADAALQGALDPVGAAVLVVNKTGADLVEFAPVGLDKPAVDLLDANGTDISGIAADIAPLGVLNGPQFEVVTPDEDDHSSKFALTLEPIASNHTGRALIPGATWARVDIKDDADESCGIETDNVTEFTTAKSGTLIIWKPANQTGVRWCIVQLGGGGGGLSTKARAMITGTVPAASFNGTTKEVTPGESSTEVATVLRWNAAGGKMEKDPDVTPNPMKARNVSSETPVRGSTAEPVVLSGAVEEIDGVADKVFVIDPFDLRSLPNYAKGTTSPDDNQVPYHEAGDGSFKLDAEECP